MKAMSINEMMATGIYNNSGFRNVNLMRGGGVLSRYLPYQYGILSATRSLEQKIGTRSIPSEIDVLCCGDQVYGRRFKEECDDNMYNGRVIKVIKDNDRVLRVVIKNDIGEYDLDPSTLIYTARKVHGLSNDDRTFAVNMRY